MLQVSVVDYEHIDIPDLSSKDDGEIADLVLELVDEMGARSAHAGPDGRRYAEAEIFLDRALECLKQQIRANSYLLF